MDKKIFEQEKLYLENVENTINNLQDENKKKIEEISQAIESQKQYFSQVFPEVYDSDGDTNGLSELAQVNLMIEDFEVSKIAHQNKILALQKQKKNPYFGRFDFVEEGQEKSSPFYIGLGFIQTQNKINLVYDWRADICSLYYDNKIGKTFYTCSDGQIDGTVTARRQYKIQDGKLEYYLDSKLLIDDEILMEQLSKNSTTKMHEIVSTIQKEQNVLIRDNMMQNVIVQGVAGSGKTSIAMHRISYLLYKYRNSLKNEDILVISPSTMFADYINDVLPQLGDGLAFTTTFNDIARQLTKLHFETREEMLEKMISNQNQKDFENVAIKSSFEFVSTLQNFLSKDLCNLFVPTDMIFGLVELSKDEIKDIFFNKLPNLSIYKRIDIITGKLVESFHRLTETEKENLSHRAKELLYEKFVTTDPVKIYNLFLRQNGLEEITQIGAYDIAPILLIQESMFSLKHSYTAKYVIIDEMQDYTPCHFLLFEKLWECKKMFLGDINQSIDRTLPSNYLKNLSLLTKAEIKFLNKSYRSTLEISKYSQKILGKKVAENVNRSGEEVEFIKKENCAKEIEEILKQRQSNKATSSQKIAIICKTKKHIQALQSESAELKKIKQFDNVESMENTKVVFATPASAKGVEFDCVIIPFADSKTYKNELDKNLLYVSATRALHKLIFVCDTTPCKFLMKTQKN